MQAQVIVFLIEVGSRKIFVKVIAERLELVLVREERLGRHLGQRFLVQPSLAAAYCKQQRDNQYYCIVFHSIYSFDCTSTAEL